MKSFILKNKWLILLGLAIFVITAAVELWMGRLPLGPDGKFALWAGNIWSSEQSQRLTDPYSFTHFMHGICFFALIWIALRKLPVRYRFIAAILLEACWELLENSPIIINRYRSVTISLGYEGDSILNSLSDICFAGLGFLFAWRTRLRIVILTVIAIELILLFWIRDNLTLNLIMLIHPIDAIKVWQSAGHIS